MSRGRLARLPVVTPERFRVIVSSVLIGGLSVSCALIAAGLLSALLVGWQASLRGAPVGAHRAVTDFGGVLANLAEMRPIGFTQLGLLTLIATPVLRVAVSLVAFALERDRLYVALTAVVLLILLTSLFVLH